MDCTNRLCNYNWRGECTTKNNDDIIAMDCYGECTDFKKKSEVDCIEEGVCPKCGFELDFNEIKESRGEYFGFPAYESIYKAVCKRCDWKED